MLDCNVPPMKVLVRQEYLYDMQSHFGEFQEAILVSAKSIQGLALTFQVLLDNGVLRDKLPVSALCWKECEPQQLDLLQVWDCASYEVTCNCLNFLSGLSVDVYGKDRKWHGGEYIFTFNWSGNYQAAVDLSLAEVPEEHKSGHFIKLDSGNFAIQPNNRIRVYEPSFVTKDFPEKPDYKVCTHAYKVENAKKWITEDTDRYMYEFEEQE
jgi:hypothetical protein